MIIYLVNALWQTPLLAAGAWLLIRITAVGPRLQHRIWIAALALAVCTPALSMRPDAAPPPQHPPATFARSAELSAIGQRQHSRVAAGLPDRPSKRAIRLPARWLLVSLAAPSAVIARWVRLSYLAGVLFGVLRIVGAWLVSAHLVRHSSKADFSTPRAETWAQCVQRMGVRQPEVRVSSQVRGPALAGIVSPVLLLPAAFVDVSEERAQAVFLHELAHFARRDCLVNLLLELLMLPVLWHPAAQAISRRIRCTREMVCDARAAEAMRSGQRYADCLIALAGQMLGMERGNEPAIALFSKNTLEERVMELISERPVASLRMKLVRGACGPILAAATLALTCMLHVTACAASPAPPAVVRSVAQVAIDKPGPAGASGAPIPPAAHGADGKGKRVAPPAHTGANASTMAVARSAEAPADSQWSSEREDVQKQLDEALAQLRMDKNDEQSRDIARQLAAAMAKVNSPEFKREMEAMEKQLQDTQRELQTQWPVLNKQIEEAARQAAESAAKVDSPELKRQMETIQKQMQSGEFQERMQKAQRRLEELQKQWQAPQPR